MITDDEVRRYARQYHTEAFVKDDPVQFPRRYTDQRDIEISGYITSRLAYGMRAQIIKAADRVDRLFAGKPFEYVMSRKWMNDFPKSKDSFYRFTTYADMRMEFIFLYDTYRYWETMQSQISMQMWMERHKHPIFALAELFACTCDSCEKRHNMFLRWMVRKDSPVDIGCWTSISPASLVIPMDTHVIRMANEWGMLDSKTPSMNNALKLTERLDRIFPGDPCMGDFALFGYGVEHGKEAL